MMHFPHHNGKLYYDGNTHSVFPLARHSWLNIGFPLSFIVFEEALYKTEEGGVKMKKKKIKLKARACQVFISAWRKIFSKEVVYFFFSKIKKKE